MHILESTPQRLVVQSGSTTLTLDKDLGAASLQRKVLFSGLRDAVRGHESRNYLAAPARRDM